MHYRYASVFAAFLLASPFQAAGQGYQPSYENPDGSEIVAVYLTASTCGPCIGPEMPELIDSVKVQLKRQAEARGQRFRAVFVGIDWEPENSIALAMRDGSWDELVVGRNWFNLGAEHYIWGDPNTTPAMPQFVVFEQSITTDGGIEFGERLVLVRVMGPDGLAAWVENGSPIPESPGQSGN
jgi:hypothetical protein